MGCVNSTNAQGGEANTNGRHSKSNAPTAGPQETVDISHFHKIRQIGMGGFAEVFVAQRLNGMRELVAIKRVDKLRVLRFKEETRTTPRGEVKTETRVRMSSTVWVERNVWALVDSPFLVPLLHCFQDDKYLYFVMPLFGPGDLNMLLRTSGCMPESALRFYMAEVVLALEALHSASIVYRDLKPHNVLMRPDGHICLSDFGLCKQVPPGGDGVSEIRGHVGTKGFQAPEIIRNTGHSYPVDFFALGVTLFRLATDARLFPKSKVTFNQQIPISPVHRVLRPPDDPSLSRAHFTSAELAQQHLAHALALGLEPAQAAQSAQELAALFSATSGGGYANATAPVAFTIVGSTSNYAVGALPSGRRPTMTATTMGGSGRGHTGSPVSMAPTSSSARSASGSSAVSHQAIAQTVQLAVASGVGTPQPGEYVVSLSPELIDLVQQLVDIDPQYRLGTRNRLLRPANHYSSASLPGGGVGSGTPRSRHRDSVARSPRLGPLTPTEEPSNAELCSESAMRSSTGSRRGGPRGGRGTPRGRDASDEAEDSAGGSEGSAGGGMMPVGGDNPRMSVLAMRQGRAPVQVGAGDKKSSRRSPHLRGGRTPTTGNNAGASARSPRMQTFRGRDANGQWNSLHNGFAEIKAHPFFAEIDWDALASGRLAAPFVPQLNVSSISQSFKQQLPEKARKDGVVPKRLTRAEQTLFQGFELNTAYSPQQAAKAQKAAVQANKGLGINPNTTIGGAVEHQDSGSRGGLGSGNSGGPSASNSGGLGPGNAAGAAAGGPTLRESERMSRGSGRFAATAAAANASSSATAGASAGAGAGGAAGDRADRLSMRQYHSGAGAGAGPGTPRGSGTGAGLGPRGSMALRGSGSNMAPTPRATSKRGLAPTSGHVTVIAR